MSLDRSSPFAYDAHRWINRHAKWLALVSGAVLPLAFAPLNLWPIAILSLVGYWLAIAQCARKRTAFLIGWLFGVGFWGSGVSWVYVSIQEFGYMPMPIAAAITCAFIASLSLLHGLQTLLIVHFAPNANHRAAITPPIWVLMEWLRTWLLSGFPWLFMGYTATATPLIYFSQWTGVYGVSLIVVGLAVALGWIIHKSIVTRRSLRHLVPWTLAVAGITVTGHQLKSMEWTKPTGAAVRFSLVQPNINQHLKWDPNYRLPTLHFLTELSSNQLADVDVLVWPEAALPDFFQNEQTFVNDTLTTLAPHNTTLITGALSAHQSQPAQNPPAPPTIFNSIYSLGSGSGVYHKTRLVPFGEYVPLENWIRGVAPFFDLPMSSIHAGPPGQDTLKDGQGHTYAPLICYEVVYPDLVASLSQQANFLITLSNDAWFGESWGPLQHFEMAQVRAIETGKPLIRATNTGLTAIVDHTGEIVAQAPRFTRTQLHGAIEPRTGTTPFAKLGSWPTLLLCALLIGFIVRRSHKRHLKAPHR